MERGREPILEEDGADVGKPGLLDGVVGIGTNTLGPSMEDVTGTQSSNHGKETKLPRM